jgi:hypothetical protein
MRVRIRVTFKGGLMFGSLGEFLEREAGHVLIGFGLILVGFALWKAGMPKSEDLTPFALGLIARSMIGAGKTKQVADGKNPEAA